MAERIIMPKQGLQMTEGTITRWLINEGEDAVSGEPLFEMETDKLTITMDSPVSGILLKIVRGVGETVPITETIGIIGENGEDITELLKEISTTVSITSRDESRENDIDDSKSHEAIHVTVPAGAHKYITPRARMRAEERGLSVANIIASGPDDLVIERDVLSYKPADAIYATPLAKKVASLEGTDLVDIPGTGSHGKVTVSDVRTAARSRTAVPRMERSIPMSTMRKIIAKRMTESLRTQAQLTHTISADMTNVSDLIAAYKCADSKLSYNDIILYAVSRALTEYPIMNASLRDDEIILHDYVNLGMAVALETGLIVPNIKDADLLRLPELGVAARELARKSRAGELMQEDYEGGTFTVSNLGMYELDEFTAIVNPPEAGILAIGAVRNTPVAVGNVVEIRPILKMTLTYDHRIVDGAPAAEFLRRIKRLIEEPTFML